MLMNSPRSPALKTLQTSPNGVHLVGKRRTPAKRKETSTKKLTDFLPKIERISTKSIDASTTTDSLLTKRDASVGTDVANLSTDKASSRDNVVKMLTSKEPTLEYWKALAEERRLALDDALKENLDCWQQIAFLKETNRRLEDLAKENQELADLLRSAINDEEAKADGETDASLSPASNSD